MIILSNNLRLFLFKKKFKKKLKNALKLMVGIFDEFLNLSLELI